MGVDAAGRWGESHASYPGRSVRLLCELVTLRGVVMGEQKSAEAIVAAAHGGEGPNTRSRTGTERSMPEGDADKKAGKPERTRRVGGGTAEGTGCLSSGSHTGGRGVVPSRFCQLKI